MLRSPMAILVRVRQLILYWRIRRWLRAAVQGGYRYPLEMARSVVDGLPNLRRETLSSEGAATSPCHGEPAPPAPSRESEGKH